MTGVEIRLGADWKRDVAHLSRIHAERGDPGELDLVCVQDVIDIVIGEDNITAPIPRDSIFPFVTDLLSALSSLMTGAPKACVRFTEAPWVIVLARRADPDLIEVSLLNTGRDLCVVIHNHPTPLRPFLEAAATVARDLTRDLVSIHPRFAHNPIVKHLGHTLHGLPRLAPPIIQKGEPQTSARCEGRVSAGQLTLDYELDLGHPDLIDYEGAEALDLHALLCGGRIALSIEGRPGALVLSRGYPVLTARKLLDESTSPKASTPSTRARLIQAHPVEDDPKGLWEIAWRPEGPRRSLLRRPQPPTEVSPWIVRAPLSSLLLVVAALVEAISEAIVAANAALDSEARLSDMRRDAKTLRARCRDTLEGDLLLEDAEAHLKFSEDTRLLPRDAPSDNEPQPLAPFPLEVLRRVTMRCRWSFQAPQIRWNDIELCGNTALVPIDEGQLQGVALDTGAHLFTAKRASWTLSGGSLLGLDEEGLLQRLDPNTGAAIWASDVGRGWGGIVAPVGFESSARRWRVLATEGGALAVDDATGQTLWGVRRALGRATGMLSHPALIVFSGTDEGALTALDPRTGQVLWRTRLDARGVHLVGAWGKTLWVSARSPQGMRLVALERFTGHKLWARPLSGWPVDEGVRHGDTILLALEEIEGARAISLDLADGTERWSRTLPGVGLGGPTAPRLCGDLVLIKTDNGELWAMRADTGELSWRTPLGASDLLFHNLALQRQDGVLVAAAGDVVLIDPTTGTILHRLGELPRHPVWLRALAPQRLLIGDPGLPGARGAAGDDILSCFEVGHFLALVK